MNNYISAVREASASGNSYAALSLALTLPDMCAALVEPKARVGERYRRWWDKYAPGLYTSILPGGHQPFLNSADAYALRCAVLHQGFDDISEHSASDALDRFAFVQPTTGRLHLLQVNRSLALQVSIFCEDIAAGAEAFLLDTADDEEVQGRLARMLVINDPSRGFTM